MSRLQSLDINYIIAIVIITLMPLIFEISIVFIQFTNQKWVDHHFKAWVKAKKFELMNIPGLGVQDALVVPNKNAGSIIILTLLNLTCLQ